MDILAQNIHSRVMEISESAYAPLLLYVKLKARGPNQARERIIFGPRDDI